MPCSDLSTLSLRQQGQSIMGKWVGGRAGQVMSSLESELPKLPKEINKVSPLVDHCPPKPAYI